MSLQKTPEQEMIRLKELIRMFGERIDILNLNRSVAFESLWRIEKQIAETKREEIRLLEKEISESDKMLKELKKACEETGDET